MSFEVLAMGGSKELAWWWRLLEEFEVAKEVAKLLTI